jgi:pantoate--beta-alanine ligase
MNVATSRAEFFGVRETLAGPVALVPTMGALHAGHAALLDAAREWGESVVATIFVNPLQFGPHEDFGRYPRSLQADLVLCERSGVDVVWTPGVSDVFPVGEAQVRVDPGPLGNELEGAARPGHFAGVLTMVAKLFNLVRPALAFLGEKDYQQLALVRRMVADLDLGVGVAGVPTVRDGDGLALSSRNAYLSASERRQALALPQALAAGQAAAARGPDAVLAAARAVLSAQPAVALDYLELRGRDLGPAPPLGSVRLLAAARVGGTRLLDNVGIEL